MPMDARDIENLIKEGIPGRQGVIRDLAGDGDHYAAEVVAEQLPRQEPRAAAPDGLRRRSRAIWAACCMRWRCRPACRSKHFPGDLFLGLFAFILFAIGLTAYAVMRLAKEGLFTAGSNRGWSERQGIRNAIGNKILFDSKYATLRNWLLATYSIVLRIVHSPLHHRWNSGIRFRGRFMSIVSDFVEQVTKTVRNEGMRKIGGKRRRRRLSPSQRLAKQIEAMIKPAKQQVSRKRTTRARSKTKRRAY
jgi:hypothetical protein